MRTVTARRRAVTRAQCAPWRGALHASREPGAPRAIMPLPARATPGVVACASCKSRTVSMPRAKTARLLPAPDSLPSLLAEATRRATADLRRLLDERGLPMEQWRVLEALGDERGRSMSELAEAVEMKLPSLSKLIDRMVSSALVQRALDPADQRRVLVYVSDIGLAKLRGLRGPVARELSSIETALDRDDRDTLKRLLQAFIERRA